MKFLSLDEMITPKILTGIYILTTILAAFAAIVTLIGGSVSGAIVWAVVAIFNRILFECIIVVFKNNEYLRRIANALDGGQPDNMADILKKTEQYKDGNASDWKNYHKDSDPQDKQ